MESTPTPAAELAQAAAEREERARRRMRQTVRDMVLSLLVVGALAVLIAQPWRQNSVVVPVPDVRWQAVTETFAASVSWPVLAPQGLPTTWRANSARIEPTLDGRTALHVGWLTPDEQYVGLEQSDTADLRFVSERTASGAPTGVPYLSDGRQWDRLVSADGATRSLVHRVPGADGRDQLTYVVTGSADWPELERLAGRLAVVRPPTPTPS